MTPLFPDPYDATSTEPYFSYDLDFTSSHAQDLPSLFLPDAMMEHHHHHHHHHHHAPPDHVPPSKRQKTTSSVHGASKKPTPPLSITTALPATPSNRPRMRNFQCPHPGCGKSFTDNAHLRDHMFVHTGEKNLRCPDCDKCFARVASLRSHRRVHTGERPFVCLEEGCGKRYASRAALRMHSSLHAKAALPPPPGKLSPVKKRQKKSAKMVKPHAPSTAAVTSVTAAAATSSLGVCTHGDDRECHRGRCQRLSEKVKQQRQVILDLQAQLATTTQQGVSLAAGIVSPSSIRSAASSPTKPSKASLAAKKKKAKPPKKNKSPKAKRKKLASTSSSGGGGVPMVAPLELLQDGIKPFKCMLLCGRTFANYFQLAFHAKQHPDSDPRAVLGDQLPHPVGPKYCPVDGCEFSESGGKCMKTLQIVKRHWQRVHQNDRPFLCPDCPPTHAPKAFKTKDNLTAHRKECRKRSHLHHLLMDLPSAPPTPSSSVVAVT
ncbi:Aste57867_640 [Aphanomyces stellatus]|uniref:Aste57867_640 protein n=1 Tax=Aphanomyces stellatus TaxID=120398 RepID=A0A485K3G1_9STRA|nr:hypothetical protein As57867_000639 [Aphanomyces stellatus]VFT77865.1 Aste57867_640 [Aphanomyces stellatus]